ncbi:MAG: hypothetical protein NT045_06745 [Candidatus Aureabacteria bacterium]|nr:hypothetical protein [Candidatus Auribacterota bacterium]
MKAKEGVGIEKQYLEEKGGIVQKTLRIGEEWESGEAIRVPERPLAITLEALCGEVSEEGKDADEV